MKQQPTEPPQVFSKLRQNLLPVALAILLLCLVCISLGVFLRSAQQLAKMPNPFVPTATPTFARPTKTRIPTIPPLPTFRPFPTPRPFSTYKVIIPPSHYNEWEYVPQCISVYNGLNFVTHCSMVMRARRTSTPPATPYTSTVTPTATATSTPTPPPPPPPTSTPTLTPTSTSTPTPTPTPTPTFLESPALAAGVSLSSLCCFSVLLTGLLVWMARRWSKKR
jgi:hypothetical protein